VFVIGKTPKPLKRFFGNLCPSFTKPQWPHFQALVLVYAMAHGRRNIARMNLFLEDQTQRQRRQDFLVESPWDGAGALNVGARAVLMAMRPQKGELLEVLIDGSHAAKRGKTMEGAHRYFDPVTKSYQFGHAFVLCVLRFRGVAIPWAVRLLLLPVRKRGNLTVGLGASARLRFPGRPATDSGAERKLAAASIEPAAARSES
jgi:hypothetical protein